MASTTPKRRTVADQVNDLIATSVRFEHEYDANGRHRLTLFGVATMRHGDWTDYRSPATVKSIDESIEFMAFTDYWNGTFQIDLAYAFAPVARPTVVV